MVQTGELDAELDEGHCQPPVMHFNLSTASQDSGSSLQAQLRINTQPQDGEAMDPVLHKVRHLTSIMRKQMPSLASLCSVCSVLKMSEQPEG